jgi:hypothetical protein
MKEAELSELTNQSTETGLVLREELLAAVEEELCGCGKPLKHWGGCRIRTQKAVQVKADRKAKGPAKSAPVIAFFHLHVEGDYFKLQLTGSHTEELKAALVTLGNSLGFKITVS